MSKRKKAPEDLATLRKISVRQIGMKVQIDLHCSSEYEARVMLEDVADRLQAGEEVALQATFVARVQRT